MFGQTACLFYLQAHLILNKAGAMVPAGSGTTAWCVAGEGREAHSPSGEVNILPHGRHGAKKLAGAPQRASRGGQAAPPLGRIHAAQDVVIGRASRAVIGRRASAA